MHLLRTGRIYEVLSEQVGILLNNLFPSDRYKVLQTNIQGSPIQARGRRHGALVAGDLVARYDTGQPLAVAD